MRQRELIGELMDDPALDPEQHRAALAGLARLNALSAASRPIARAIASLAPSRSFTLLDIATGSGDVLLATVRRLRRAGLEPQAHALDASPLALDAARRRCEGVGIELRTIAADAIRDGIDGEFDVAMSSLFLHHLRDGEALALLRTLGERCRAIVISDLDRSRAGLAAAAAVSRLATRCPVVHTDAVRSVRAALRPEEAGTLARDAGLRDIALRRIWPYRWLMTGRGR